MKLIYIFAGAGAGAKTHPVILVKPVPADRKLIRENTLSLYNKHFAHFKCFVRKRRNSLEEDDILNIRCKTKINL